MKTATILFVMINLFGCSFGLLAQIPKPESEKVTASHTHDNVVCFEQDYKPKSKASIASMTTRQLIDELIEIEPAAFRTYQEWDDYDDSIVKRIRQAGVKALSVLTEYMNKSFFSRSSFECDKLRFDTVKRIAHDIDRFEFRLRGSSEGKLTIDAFERAIERAEKPGFTTKDVSYYRPMFLRHLKGISHYDANIQDTFWVRYRIEMSETELLEFGNFLIELDPAYPSWSDWDFTKDYSRINEAGNPRQVYVLKKPDRFYEAYLDFKKANP